MISVEEIEISQLICKHPIVSDFWAELKKVNNWLANAFRVNVDRRNYELLILSKKIFLNYYLAYIPFSPIPLDDGLPINLKNLSSIINIISKNLINKYIFFRFDFPFNYDQYPINSNKFVLSKESIQPEATVRIDLERAIEDIKSDYRKRAKRNIKTNSGIIEVRDIELTKENVDLWYDLYKETANRDGFVARSKDYIDAVLFTRSQIGRKLICGFKDGELVGGIIVIFCNDLALYLFGASMKIDKYSPSYSIQNYAIETLKKLGVKKYDLYGIGYGDKSSHLNSLTLFKTSFGGEILTRIPTIDYPNKKILFKLFKLAEKIRLSLYR